MSPYIIMEINSFCGVEATKYIGVYIKSYELFISFSHVIGHPLGFLEEFILYIYVPWYLITIAVISVWPVCSYETFNVIHRWNSVENYAEEGL